MNKTQNTKADNAKTIANAWMKMLEAAEQGDETRFRFYQMRYEAALAAA